MAKQREAEQQDIQVDFNVWKFAVLTKMYVSIKKNLPFRLFLE